MNIKKIKELVELMNENGLSEIEIEEETGTAVELAKQGVIEQRAAEFEQSKRSI